MLIGFTVTIYPKLKQRIDKDLDVSLQFVSVANGVSLPTQFTNLKTVKRTLEAFQISLPLPVVIRRSDNSDFGTLLDEVAALNFIVQLEWSLRNVDCSPLGCPLIDRKYSTLVEDVSFSVDLQKGHKV